MSYKITYTHPDFPNDYEFDLYGVGLVTNGKPHTLKEEEEVRFVQLTGQSVKDYFKGSESVKVEGTTDIKGGVDSVVGGDE